jgi:hypothetical protein
MAHYKELLKNDCLAELVGVVLGDGNLYRHPRTENLRITCNSKDTSYILHLISLIGSVFSKKPSVIKRKGKNAVSINLYQQNISKRLKSDVYNTLLLSLGLNPQFGSNYIRLARRNEVFYFRKLIDFRNYVAL